MTQSEFVLYNYWRSSASYRVRIALNLKGIPFEYRPIHLIKSGGEQNHDSYRALNPMGQVPFLVHNNFGLGQSMAILNYLDQIKPHPHQLFPSDPKQAAKVWEICEAINSGIQPLHNVSILSDLETRFGASASQKQQFAFKWITKGLEAIEKVLEQTRGIYAVGDQITAADCMLVPQFYGSRRQEVPVEQYTHLHSIVQTCLNHPAFAKAHPDVQPDANV
jgi:maleylpyruvate isomerase